MSECAASEFLAGLSILSVVIHLGIAYYIRPFTIRIEPDPVHVTTISQETGTDTDDKTDAEEREEEVTVQRRTGYLSYFT